MKNLQTTLENAVELVNTYGAENVLLCNQQGNMFAVLHDCYRNIYGEDFYWVEVDYYSLETLEFLGSEEIHTLDDREILLTLNGIRVM